MSPALNGSSVIRLFEHSNVIEIHNGIIFEFYIVLQYLISTRDNIHITKSSELHLA